ncbi:MAG: serine/threonine-protein kinase [Butyrivibrio sp.]|nr:serine/threonine-protein kinase [Butyrivibrio sp.]
MVGEKILGYTVDEKIGSGGFGTVYKVSKTNASGTYTRALKHMTIPSQKQYADVLNSMGGDYSKADEYFAGVLKEIVNEIQIISTLSEGGTQNIVRYYENDIVESESPKRYDIYILMECLTPFTDYMYKNELTVKDVIKLGKDILTALISCHEKNIIHRDIKDDNIFVSSDGSYKLGDFGVSKMLKDRSRAESMKGTPNYIAPEVYLGKEQYDETVDIYSLGIVLYKLLNKSRNPFLPSFPQSYNSNDEDAAFEKRMKGEIPELPCDAANALGDAILRAIKTRNQRYDSAKAFLMALKQAEEDLTENELNKVINTVIAQSQETLKRNTENCSMDETIGTDLDISVKKASINNEDNDLFETVSDTFNKTPVVTEPVVKIQEDQPEHVEHQTKPKQMNDKKRESVAPVSYQEPPRVEAIQESDLRWVAFVLPVLIFAVYMILYLIILPNSYGKGVSFGQWLFSNPEEVLEKLQDQNAVFTPIYKIWGIKIGMYLLWIGFIASLFNLGRVIQNKKPEYNINALMHDKEPYYKAMEINESIKAVNNREANTAKALVRNITERLKNESAFGIGSDSVINCEKDIIRCLKEIEENIQALYDDKTVKQSGDVIVSNCKTIQTKLKIRTELKKK